MMPAPDNRPLVSVVVPAHNETAVLPRNLGRLADHLATLKSAYRFEVIVVDDGSTDGTGDAAEAFARGRDDVRVLRHAYNFRLGQALRTAFRESRGSIVVVLDADLSYSPEHVGLLLARMEETRAKIVIASPYAKGGRVANVPLLRRVLSLAANRFLCLMATKDFFSDKLTNITGMVRAYDGDFIRTLSLWAMDVDVNPEIINKAKILRARIVEVPATLDWAAAKAVPGRRRAGMSLRLLRSVVQSMVSGFMFRPFMFYIVPGLVLLLLSLYPLAWAARHTLRFYAALGPKDLSLGYRLSEAVGEAFKLSPHAFIVGGISLMVAIQLISLGLLALQKKRYFAELFYIASNMSRDLVRGEAGGVSLPDPLRKA